MTTSDVSEVDSAVLRIKFPFKFAGLAAEGLCHRNMAV